MEIKKLLREDNRIIGGVCSGISEKYGLQIWMLRLLFIIVSWVLLSLPILIYLILWITIPSRNQAKKTERKRIYLLQAVGLIVGAIIGGFIPHVLINVLGDGPSGAYAKLFVVLLSIPIGAIIGFFVAKKFAFGLQE